MKTRNLLQNSFIVNTFSNLIGFGGLVGVMLRSYFYSKYKEEKEGVLRKHCFRHIVLFNRDFIVGMDCIYLLLDFSLLKETKWLLIAVILVSLYFPIFIGIYIFAIEKGNSI